MKYEHSFAGLLGQAHSFVVLELNQSSPEVGAEVVQLAQSWPFHDEHATPPGAGLQGHPAASAQASPLPSPEGQAKLAAHSWTLVCRWCAWLDAVIHFHVHSMSMLAPELLSPDTASGFPFVADFGTATLDEKSKITSGKPAPPRWLWRPGHSGIPVSELRELSAGIVGEDPWPFRQLDTVLIRLFPLARIYNWPSTGLLELVRILLRRPDFTPAGPPRTSKPIARTISGCAALAPVRARETVPYPVANSLSKFVRRPNPNSAILPGRDINNEGAVMRSVEMVVGGYIILTVGLAVGLYWQVRFLVLAYRRSVWWLCGCLFVPFVDCVFLMLNFKAAAKPFGLSLLGLLGAVLGSYMAGVEWPR